MTTKDVYVILAFHAHEPHWDMPERILEKLDDAELRDAVRGENWVVKRAQQGRDIYGDLIELGRRLDAPLCLEATNELLMQIVDFLPETFRNLRAAYRSGALHPIYGHAHHTHIALLSDAEVADEIRLNKEFIHDILGAPYPRYCGLFPTEGSVDSHKLQGVANAGIDYLIFPQPDPRKAHISLEGEGNPLYQPFLIGPGLIALPRHFPLSQDIWRPITKWKPEGVKSLGYLLGEYYVLEEEYRERQYVSFPITKEEAIAEYHGVLQRAIDEAPPQGLLLYIQDLELMDFGEEALELIGEAWQRVRQGGGAQLHFVTPDDYLDTLLGQGGKLPRLKFHQISWAPEIHLVLRYDGHYPPRNAGRFKGVDFLEKVFKKHPFIFWEPGRYLSEVFDCLLSSFGFSSELKATATELKEKGYLSSQLSLAQQVALHSRLIKRACNWGWQPEEGLQKRPYLHGYRLASLFRSLLEDGRVATRVGHRFTPISPNSLHGAERLLEILIDTRINYLQRGIVALSEKDEHAEQNLAASRRRRARAQQHIRNADDVNRQLCEAGAQGNAHLIATLLEELREHCKQAFLALDYIQRAWGHIADKEGMVVEMYKYLYKLYPPLFPAILAETLSGAELTKEPPLR